MKVLGAVLSALFAVAIIVAIGWYVVPRFQSSLSAPGGQANISSSSNGDAVSNSQSGNPVPLPKPDSPIVTPQSSANKLRDDIAKQRIPFFHFLSQTYSDTIVHASVLDDIETLDIEISKADNGVVTNIVQNVLQTRATDYGFKRARFMVRANLGSVEPFHVVAESSFDGSSHWNTFWK